jgi:class 3 adenylate cyclase/tetratricopeptide (TPR) repeat protein
MGEARVRCPACQAETADARFCGECGARLPAPCLACGTRNPPGQKFCGECGAALTGPAAPASAGSPVAASAGSPAPPGPAPPSLTALRQAAPVAYTPKHLVEKVLRSQSALTGERKQLTVLFADVSGFTAMSERLDPEEVHTIMDRAFDVILGAVHRYEGTINQFLGDGVMALFGAPIAHEDHAQRAIRAALAIQDGLSPLKREVRQRHQVKFRIRMGINTGEVVVGAIGRDLRMDYTALGDTVNLAARLLSVALPGQIVVSRRTRRPAEGYFEFQDLGQFTLKGKREPVPAWAVLGEIRGRTRLEVSRTRGLTPLIGRQAELLRLSEAFHRVQAGQSAVVLVVGEPGVGKSRLLYEFLRGLDGAGVLELEASCLSHGHALPYHPVVELVRRYLGLPDPATDAEVTERITERLGALDIQEADAGPLLAHFLGLSAPPELLARLSGAQLKERTHDLLRGVLFRASEDQPAVVIIENLHWLDPSSEDFLRDLVPKLAGQRILLVLSTRPGWDAPWLQPAVTARIDLPGLDARDVHGMVGTVLRAERVSDRLLELLQAKGDGNPLYVEEILRALSETGRIVIEDGEARLTVDDIALPGSIHDIIAARIDRLPEAVKHTLLVAAVIGREFPVPVLAHALGRDVDLAAHLAELAVLDLVFQSAHEPEPAFRFKHAVTHEVAYGSLLERQRRGHHAAVGRALEALRAGRLDEVVELLAHHYGRSAEDEPAVDYALRAAEKAQRRWAHAEALALFGGALRRLAEMADTEANRRRRIDAVVEQSEIKFALGQHAEHVQALEAIREVVEAAADAPRRAAWYGWAGFLHSLTGTRPDVSIAYCREAVAVADAAGLDEIRAISECCLTHVYVLAGRLGEALAAGERALALFEARGNVWWACRTLWGLSMAANASGLWGRSLDYCRRALDHGRAVDDLRLKVVGWWRTGSTHIQQGAPRDGLRCLDEADALGPVRFDAVMVKAMRGYALVKAGELDPGIAILEEIVAWLAQSGLRYTRAVMACLLAEGYLRRGERDRARELAEDVVTTSREVGYRHLEGVAERLLGEALLPDGPAAGGHLAQAGAIAEEVGSGNETAKVLVAEATVAAATVDRDRARALLQEALGRFENLGTVDEVTRTRAALLALDDRPAA